MRFDAPDAVRPVACDSNLTPTGKTPHRPTRHMLEWRAATGLMPDRRSARMTPEGGGRRYESWSSLGPVESGVAPRGLRHAVHLQHDAGAAAVHRDGAALRDLRRPGGNRAAE